MTPDRTTQTSVPPTAEHPASGARSTLRARALAGVAILTALTTFAAIGLEAGPAAAAVSVDPTTTAAPTTTVAPPTTTAPPAPAPAPVPTVGPSGLAYLGPALQRGSAGIEVLQVQFILYWRGFWLHDWFGAYGDSTRHAVVAFQKYYGLPRTGVVDFWTRLALTQPIVRVTPVHPGSGHRGEIDLARQVLIVSTGDGVDAVFDISSGTRRTPTPRGLFRIQREIRGRRVSSLGVLFSPRYFTGGYAIHGSPSVPASPASHGCVRLTNQAIDAVWAMHLMPIGTPLAIF